MARDMTVVGRREDCDLRIPLGEVLEALPHPPRRDSLKLEDLGSSNGTFLNGSRVQEAILSPATPSRWAPSSSSSRLTVHPSDEELQPVQMESSDGAAGILEDDNAPMAVKPGNTL
jgi:hypothetical protein